MRAKSSGIAAALTMAAEVVGDRAPAARRQPLGDGRPDLAAFAARMKQQRGRPPPRRVPHERQVRQLELTACDRCSKGSTCHPPLASDAYPVSSGRAGSAVHSLSEPLYTATSSRPAKARLNATV